MSRDVPKNVAASVKARLLDQARAAGRPFNEVLQYYAIERFLYRLAQSQHAERFVLKGALMLRTHHAAPMRPTRDIDLLGRGPNVTDHLESVVRDCCTVEVDDDGIRFDPETVTREEITKEAEYHGVRITFRGYLGTARVSMQIDVGFGDVVVPGPLWIDYPELLDYGQPRLLGYTLESAVAEKFQAMVALGEANSRMKDFYDVWFIAREHTFDGEQFSEALRQTFERRETDLPAERPYALTPAFYDDPIKQQQWSAFMRKTKLDGVPSLQEVTEEISAFVLPPSVALAGADAFRQRWESGGPWRASASG